MYGATELPGPVFEVLHRRCCKCSDTRLAVVLPQYVACIQHTQSVENYFCFVSVHHHSHSVQVFCFFADITFTLLQLNWRACGLHYQRQIMQAVVKIVFPYPPRYLPFLLRHKVEHSIPHFVYFYACRCSSNFSNSRFRVSRSLVSCLTKACLVYWTKSPYKQVCTQYHLNLHPLREYGRY